MAHWGWYWKIKQKHISKTICSALQSIDSFVLFKKGEHFSFEVKGYQLFGKLKKNHYEVRYSKNKEAAYKIVIEKQSCNYGGYRYYFHCPLCQKRMRKLYFNGVFACRKCLNLCYHSQLLRPTERYSVMEYKINDRIKNKGGDLSSPKRPRGMHRKTFERLKDRAKYYDARSGLALFKEVRQWYGSRAEKSLDSNSEYEWKMIISEYEQRHAKVARDLVV